MLNKEAFLMEKANQGTVFEPFFKKRDSQKLPGKRACCHAKIIVTAEIHILTERVRKREREQSENRGDKT